MLSRRTMLLAPLALSAAPTGVGAAEGKMTLAIHQNTSRGAGYRKSLEGWARAGIKYVEITAALLDEFLKTDSLAARRRVLTDLGLTPVSCACGVSGLWEPNPNHAAALENLKKRCEMFATLGLTRIYAPTATTQKFTQDDYKTGVDNMREVGEIAKQFRHDGDGRVRAHLDVHLHAADAAQDDARGGASEHAAAARLLSLLVRPATSSRTSI